MLATGLLHGHSVTVLISVPAGALFILDYLNAERYFLGTADGGVDLGSSWLTLLFNLSPPGPTSITVK